MTPLDRIAWIAEQSDYAHASATLYNLLKQYEEFLVSVADEKALADQLMDKEARKPYLHKADLFGHTMFSAMNEIGKGSNFHRLLVV